VIRWDAVWAEHKRGAVFATWHRQALLIHSHTKLINHLRFTFAIFWVTMPCPGPCSSAALGYSRG
jgi:hypothetical protein